MLENIHSPGDIRNLSARELEALRNEIRGTIIKTVSENGGHLSSNLGLVEATLAIHRVFDAPRDKIIFDVSHQSYTHKLITGRYDKFNTLRQYGGISGFTSPAESEYDTVYAGHSGSSISVALGIAAANKRRGSDAYTVAVVGDGSFTNGMIYEAIDHAADNLDLNVVIILNDNEMSISQNVGGISKYLSRVRTSRGYLTLKHTLDDLLVHIPLVGKPLAAMLKWTKDSLKRMFIRDTLFENLGMPYVGPVDGHDIPRLEAVLSEAKSRGGVWLIHIVTKKGLGYKDAENNPDKYHSTCSFDPNEGLCPQTCESFTSVFGDIMCRLAKDDASVYAVTSAMRDGTGLCNFANMYPDRFADVGIAEEHSVAYCGGLAISGMNPVCAIYSTFSQRVYDQVMHDAALQRAHITLALDHCGIVPGDGVTHQGIFDAALFASIPGVTMYSPETYAELADAMADALAGEGVVVVRYPKGAEHHYDRRGFVRERSLTHRIPQTPDCVIVTYSIITEEAVKAVDMLADRYRVGIVKLTTLLPLDADKLAELLSGCRLVYVLEEGVLNGGVGERLAAFASERGLPRVHVRAIDGEFIPHGDRKSLLELLHLDASSVANEIERELSVR